MTYNKQEDYCSCSPDKLFGVKFNYACYLHDRQYRNEVKHRKTRKEADVQLREVMIKKFTEAGKKKRGYIIAYIYYLAVRLFGWIYWVEE